MTRDDQVTRTFAPPDAASRQRKRAAFLNWLAEGGLPDLTGLVEKPQPEGAHPSDAPLGASRGEADAPVPVPVPP
ncbi:hypothetical protein QF035_004835 [Streptomyces umbrinus]|uniref:Uncharacterized protein n=1 Tax=Streptomyces umbrinus TaxID=67370 RepID=A0ABU0SUN1_9ACTN|nr:hypothetical protein [Streptomyces umbrinus]